MNVFYGLVLVGTMYLNPVHVLYLKPSGFDENDKAMGCEITVSNGDTYYSGDNISCGKVADLLNSVK